MEGKTLNRIENSKIGVQLTFHPGYLKKCLRNENSY